MRDPRPRPTAPGPTAQPVRLESRGGRVVLARTRREARFLRSADRAAITARRIAGEPWHLRVLRTIRRHLTP